MNSFFVPQLGSQIYTMAGMTSQLNLQADRAGTYEGLSAQFSGEGFPGMRFAVRAIAPDEYATWIAGTKATGSRLDQAAYADLAKPSKNVAPSTYSNVESGLFDKIVSGAESGMEHGVSRPMERKP
jgi:cytochrome o ubiquinol oxidase subunit 2